MTDTWLICGIIIGVILAVFIPIIIWDLKKNTKFLTKEQKRALEDEQLNAEGEIITTHAEVVDMACGVNTIGYQAYKQPKAVKYFVIKFKNDNGDFLNVFVSEEMYQEFDIGFSGMLTLIDGNLDSFVPDNTDE